MKLPFVVSSGKITLSLDVGEGTYIVVTSNVMDFSDSGLVGKLKDT